MSHQPSELKIARSLCKVNFVPKQHGSGPVCSISRCPLPRPDIRHHGLQLLIGERSPESRHAQRGIPRSDKVHQIGVRETGSYLGKHSICRERGTGGCSKHSIEKER